MAPGVSISIPSGIRTVCPPLITSQSPTVTLLSVTLPFSSLTLTVRKPSLSGVKMHAPSSEHSHSKYSLDEAPSRIPTDSVTQSPPSTSLQHTSMEVKGDSLLGISTGEPTVVPPRSIEGIFVSTLIVKSSSFSKKGMSIFSPP